MENDIMKTIISYGINVDKAELLKALAYDREQYEKGYVDGQAESEPKWTPVTEALPENNRQVLVYAQSVHYALAKYDEMMEPDGEWKKQWVTFDAWKPYYTIKNVIAWMPLPESWRGE